MLGAKKDASPSVPMDFASRTLLVALARASGSDGGGGQMQTSVNWSFWKGGNEEGVGLSAAKHKPEKEAREENTQGIG